MSLLDPAFAVIDLGDGTFTHVPEGLQASVTLEVNQGSRIVRRGLTESLAQRIALRMSRGERDLLDEREYA